MGDILDDAIPAGLPSQLDLFKYPSVQSAIENAIIVEYHPIGQLTNQDAPVCFILGGDSKHYLDLKRSKLFVKVKLVKKDGTDLTKDDPKAAPVNLLLQSLWCQIDCKISGTLVSISNNAYNYKAMLETILQTSTDAKSSELSTQGYFKDQGDFDSLESNTGAVSRYKMFAESKSVELEGPILEDIFKCTRFLLNNTEMELKLFRARNEFCILAAENNCKLVIEDICFKACYVDVNPNIIMSHGKALEKGNALYPFIRTDIKTFNIGTGASQFSFDNIFQNACPTKILVMFVESDRFAGDMSTNPYKFDHFNLIEIEVMVDGVSTPSKPMKMVFDKSGREVVTPYSRLYDCINRNNGMSYGNDISREDFCAGYSIFPFNLHGGSCIGNYMELKKSANVRIRGLFSKKLDQAITMIVYGEFPSVMHIEGSRNVKIE